ncbi:MAG TPA: DUF445 domain-containing protein [Caulobacteraceae bacterium]|nr:DUF445 domain-containing protein [Caulobacteraceae bacterium]
MPVRSVPQTAPGEPEDRARALSRMRLVATGLLVLMAGVFVAASLGARAWSGLPYVRAFAEAGMVGACADWFAVTALFRRPLGLPIPHTAIIPRNKARIGQALGGFIADNFLTVAVLEGKIAELELARWGGAWLGRRHNAERLARRLAALLPGLIGALPPGALREAAASGALALIRRAPAAKLASIALAAVWSDGRAQRLLDRGIDALATWVGERKPQIQAKVSEHSYRWLPRWIDRVIAEKIASGLIDIVEEMRDLDHPWRRELRIAVEGYIERLANDPDLGDRAEAFKLRLLADASLSEHAGVLWSEIETLLASPALDDDGVISGRLTDLIVAVGRWLDANQGAQRQLNGWARMFVRRVVAPRRHQIGLFIAQVVASWDTRNVVDKLELQVGRDLQYIRINGTLVGGLVGLAIFQASRWLGLT